MDKSYMSPRALLRCTSMRLISTGGRVKYAVFSPATQGGGRLAQFASSLDDIRRMVISLRQKYRIPTKNITFDSDFSDETKEVIKSLGGTENGEKV